MSNIVCVFRLFIKVFMTLTAIYLIHFLAFLVDIDAQDQYPMHLVDIVWENDKLYEISSIEIEYEIDTNFLDTDGIYFCPLYSRVSNCRFYIGYTSLIPALTHSDKLIPNSYIGPGFIFARWDTTDLKKLITPKGSLEHSTDRENGDYISIRTPFKSKKGKYLIHLESKIITDSLLVPKNNKTVISASIFCYASQIRTELGAIIFDTVKPVIKDYMYSFIELYMKSKYDRTTNIHINDIKINGSSIGNVPVSARYNANTYAMAKVVLQNGVLKMTLTPSQVLIRNEKYVQLR